MARPDVIHELAAQKLQSAFGSALAQKERQFWSIERPLGLPTLNVAIHREPGDVNIQAWVFDPLAHNQLAHNQSIQKIVLSTLEDIDELIALLRVRLGEHRR